MAIFDVNLVIGLGVILMLALAMTYITYKDTQTFFIFFAIFSAFAVWSGLLDIWVLIVNMVVLSMILVNMVYTNQRGKM